MSINFKTEYCGVCDAPMVNNICKRCNSSKRNPIKQSFSKSASLEYKEADEEFRKIYFEKYIKNSIRDNDFLKRRSNGVKTL